MSLTQDGKRRMKIRHIPLYPTVDEIAEITARDWGARSGLRVQLATVLRSSGVLRNSGSAGVSYATLVDNQRWLVQEIRYQVRRAAATDDDGARAHMDVARDYMRQLDTVRRRIRYWQDARR
jgi:hypothetical protein